jgi:putative transposase
MLKMSQKLGFIDRDIPRLSIFRQCEIIGISRSSVYYEPCTESEENLLFMRLMDEYYIKYPFYGVRRMTVYLQTLGHKVNVKRVRRLYRLMGLEAIYPKPNLSKMDVNHKKYPYLLRGIEITKVNQVWSTDITYIPMKNGFMYLTAVIDWYSRYVLAWEVSNTMDVSFCTNVVKKALKFGKPEIFNSDQGSQYTSIEFSNILTELDIKISMDDIKAAS